MKFATPDTCLDHYEKRRGAFLKELIASTPNVSLRAKEFRRWIEKNSPSKQTEPDQLSAGGNDEMDASDNRLRHTRREDGSRLR